MTTVVVDARVGLIGADTFVTTAYRASKLLRTRNRGVFGFAGDDRLICKAEDWLVRRKKKPEQIATDGDFGMLQLHKGRIYLWAEAMRGEIVLSPFDGKPAQWHAIGSGAPYALGCLAQGGTIQEALRMAELFDMGTKGPFQTMSESE